jgi:hypothetical protein
MRSWAAQVVPAGEIDAHLEYRKHGPARDDSGSSRNRLWVKAVLT